MERITACDAGRHTPRGRPPFDAEGVARGTCRGCGAPLVRTLATKRWWVSGVLGRAPPLPRAGG